MPRCAASAALRAEPGTAKFSRKLKFGVEEDLDIMLTEKFRLASGS